MNNVLNSFMDNVKTNITGLIGVCVTDIESGEAYASHSFNPDYDISIASAYNLEVVRAKLEAIKALGLTEDIEEMTIELSSQIHIINIAPSRAYFIYVALDSKKANLGIARALLNKYKSELNDLL